MNSFPVYRDTWIEMTPESLSYQSSAATIPSAEDTSTFHLKSYCTGSDLHGHHRLVASDAGPGDFFLGHLDDVNRSMSSIYSLPIDLPQDSSYNVLGSITSESKDTSGTFEQCTEASSNTNFHLSTSVGYESSLSPLSSRPCTAGYELDGLGFPPSFPEPPISSFYGCGFSPNKGFPLYSHLDQIGIKPKSSTQLAPKTNRDSFPLWYMQPYPMDQSMRVLIPQEEIAPLIEPSIEPLFPTGLSAETCTIPINTEEKYTWPSALSIPSHTGLVGTLARSGEFTTRCVQPTSLLGHPAVSAKPKDTALEPSHSANGKASFLPGDWENQGASYNETVNYPPQPLKKRAAGKKRPKRRTYAAEPQAKGKSASNSTNRKRSALSPSHEFEDTLGGPNASKKSLGAAENKTLDGRFACDRIRKDTQVVCGSKFQRSEHLKRHLATHEDLRPHQCQICERWFGRTDNLTQHIRTHDNAYGRNTKLLKAKLLQKAEQNKGMQKMEQKPSAYFSRASKKRKLNSSLEPI